MTMKRRKFKTEVQHLLNLVIHSLYTNKDIFLRELISNASDAIDRARFEALSDKAILEDDPEWAIHISFDKAARTLTVADNGIGMSADEVERNIGTIASSGTRFFLEQLEKSKAAMPPELIGQFGVGFYSVFMVADKVTLETRRAGDETTGVRWESSGSGSYGVEQIAKHKRGTSITLHLKEGMDEYLDEWKIRGIVKKYSDFVEHPVILDLPPTEDEKEPKSETLNSRKAIWARPRNEITEDEYNEFYKHVAHDFQEPLDVMHWNVEGTTEFRALLYLPQKAPFDFMMPENHNRGIHLYVKRVFITDNCEALTPQYLRFLRGVVDSSDLPLNVSRETLQEERVIRLIRNNVVKKVLDTLADMQEKKREKYESFWAEFGRMLKEGIHLDYANRDRLAEIALFESTKTEPGKFTSLAEYMERMPETQKEIYCVTGESRATLESSPLLEAFRKRDLEVLLMTDPIDEWVLQSLSTFREKPLKSVAAGNIDLEGEGEEAAKAKREETQKEFEQLTAFLKDNLKEKVKDIRISQRLTDSACCLVSDETDMGMHMEKILKSVHKDMPATKRILEVNPGHPLIVNMNRMVKDTGTHMKLGEYAQLLYDQALLTAGIPVENPVNFARRVSTLMAAESTELAGTNKQ
jgi:molecular chaperone HtpG